jgi:hypothetical protein
MSFCQKKITASGFLLLVALPLFFSIGIFVKQQFLQHQRNRRLNTESLQTITVSSASIYWVKPGKEILNDGKLFDVKSFKTVGNKIVLTGFYDNKEDKLVKNLKEIIHEKNESGSPASQLFLKFSFAAVYNNETDSFTLQDTWQIINRQFSEYAALIYDLSYPAPTPPPKSC